MSDIIQLAAGKLADPILMDWALDRYQDAAKANPARRQAMEDAWFDQLALRRWLDHDDKELLARLFTLVPPERFASLGEAIGERWGTWRGNLAAHAAPVVARCRPELALKDFSDAAGRSSQDPNVILGIVRALALLPAQDAGVLLKGIAEPLLEVKQSDAFSRDLVRNALIPIALELDRDAAIALVKDALKHAENTRAIDRVLTQVALGLFGHATYVSLAADIRGDKTTQRFTALAAFFRDGAPLAKLDRWSEGKATLNDLNGLLEAHLAEGDRAVVSAMTGALKARGLADHWHQYADFLIGAVAGACARAELVTDRLTLQEAVDLLSVDLFRHPHFDALLSRIETFPRADVAGALLGALERERRTYGSIHVAEAMGRLGWEEFVPALTRAIDEDTGDFLCEAAGDALYCIGEAAQRHLIDSWDSLDMSQRIYGVSVIEKVGGERAALFAIERAEALLDEEPEFWYRLAAAAPDPRLLARLEPQLRREQEPIDEAFYILARLLDVEHPELASAGERLRKRRAEQRARRVAIDQGRWFHDTLPLALRCPACGDVNRYDVRRVVINVGGTGDPLIGEELACASCGQWTDLEFTSEARMAITGELVKLAAENGAGLAGRSRVLVQAQVPFGGRMLPVGKVVRRCKEAVAEEPGSVADWLRLALCYEQVLARPRAGAAYAHRALRIEPNAVEAVLQQAELLAAQGKGADAFDRLDAALAAKERWRFFLADALTPAQFAARFVELYNHLLRATGRSDRASLLASSLGMARKVGRNDPCPCGSGKKYKKCCLAKG